LNNILNNETQEKRLQKIKLNAAGKQFLFLQVKHELGVDSIESQIKTLEKQLATLKEQKEALGFVSWRSDNVEIGSKAKKLIDSRTNTAKRVFEKFCLSVS